MKNITFLTSLLFFFSFAIAQKSIPDFGKIDKADLELKDCDFDKGAAAMILLDHGNASFELDNNASFRLHIERHIRIKILKEKAFERANIKIYFYSGDRYEKVEKVKASSFNLDADGKQVESEVEKKLIYTEKINKNISAITFTFPQVKVGSILEYRYTTIIDNIRALPNWDFQSSIPTRYSHFTLSIPEFYGFTSSIHTKYPMEKEQKDKIEDNYIRGQKVSYGVTTYQFAMRNLPGLQEEPYMGAASDYLQHIKFQLSQISIPGNPVVNLNTTWPRLTEELLESSFFGAQLKKQVSMEADIETQCKKAVTETEKLYIIYNYVRRQMEWTGEEDKYADDIKAAWGRKKGSAAEINFILIGMLREAKIEAYPMLVSTREHGKVNNLYPFLDQFNKVICFAFAEGKPFVLNGADDYNPARLIPYDVMGSEGFVVDKEKGGWVTLWDETMLRKNRVALQATIDDKGVMNGECIISSFDYSKNPRVAQLKESKDKFQENYFTAPYKGLAVRSLELKNTENDSFALEQKLKFSYPLSSSGDYKYFTVNMFTGLDKNPFTAETRFTDVDFGYNQSYAVFCSITIPDGYQFDELPESRTWILPDTSIVLTRIMEANVNTLSVRISLEFKRPVFYNEEYPDFRRFYKTLFDKLNEQVVIKKKT
jgi:Domain of Unknown Function with PDB structure (DUF3857)